MISKHPIKNRAGQFIILMIAVVSLFYAGHASAYMNSRTGRFMQRDPLRYVDGMNTYQYIRSRPLSLTDPSGRYPGPTDYWGPPEDYIDGEEPYEGHPYDAPSDMEATGGDLIYEFVMGVGPRDRVFLEGSHMLGELKAHSHMENVREEIRHTLSDYGVSSQGISGQIDSRPGPKLLDAQFIPGDIYNINGMGAIGSYYGEWTISQVDTEKLKASVDFKVRNQMDAKSALYGLPVNSWFPPYVNPRAAFQPTRQFWEWSEDFDVACKPNPFPGWHESGPPPAYGQLLPNNPGDMFR